MAGSQTVATFINQSQEFYDRCHEFYTPLNPNRDEIRVMHISPGLLTEDAVHLTLSHVDLADEPVYEAVSYTWGPMSPTKQVFIHGVAYNVTENQYAALRRLRTDKSRTMWMDVVCIDQANLAERAHQVSIMGKVYTNAARTEVWLGELDESWYAPISDLAWNSYMTEFWEFRDRKKFIEISTSPKRDELMKKVPHDLGERAEFVLELLAADMHFVDLPHCTISGDDIEFNRSWYDAGELVCAILQQPWWSRVWVLQEVLLCKGDAMVLFGRHRLPLATFLKASDSLRNHCITSTCCLDVLNDVFIHSVVFIESLPSLMWLSVVKTDELPGQMTIGTAVMLTNAKQATDTRDFIYGVLGLIRTEDRVPVDYTLSTEELFVLTSWQYFRTSNNFNWLEKGGSRSPSWSIDWVDTDRLGFRMNSTFAMDDTETPDWTRTRLSGNQLELPANRIGKVRLVFEKERDPALSLGRADFEIISYWLDCLKVAGFPSDLLRDPSSDDFDGEFFVELFSIFFRDTRVDFVESEARRLNEDDLCEIAFWWGGLVEIVKIGTVDRGEHIRTWWAATTFRNYTRDSALALTEDNKICLVPIGTRVGDCLYHIRACSPVMVLHAVAENEFHLVGPAYLSGSMGSEGWRRDHEEVIKLN